VPVPDAVVGDITGLRGRYHDNQFRLRVRTLGLRDEAGSPLVLIAHITTRTKRQALTWKLVTRLEDGVATTRTFGTSAANADVECEATSGRFVTRAGSRGSASSACGTRPG
jgi:hypothetical protein